MATTFVNRKLVSHKLVLFFVYGAIACLWPFLSVHMAQLGLTKEEVAIINMVVPFTSLLGPPLVGYLGLKTKRRKAVLVISIVLTAISFTALLLVPPVIRHPPRAPEMTFQCGYQGTSDFDRLMVERCGNTCYEPSPGMSAIGLQDCHHVCPEESPEVLEGGGIKMRDGVSLPHICVTLKNNTVMCHVYNVSGEAEDIYIEADIMRVIPDENVCTYPFTRIGPDGQEVSSVSCHFYSDKKCHLRCTGFPADGQPNNMFLHRCQKVEGNPLVTLLVYFFIRLIAEFFLYASVGILDATILHGCWQNDGFYARQLFWGLLPVGLLPPLVGVLLEKIVSSNESAISPKMDYTTAFIAFDLMALASVIAIAVLPINIVDYVNKCGSFAGKMFRSCETLAFFVFTFCLGIFFGFTETFFYWFLGEMSGGPFLLGLTLTTGVLPALPFVFFGDRFIRFFGHANLLITAFFAYSLRFALFSILSDSRLLEWVLLIEVLELLAYYLPWVAIMTYSEKLAPKMLTTTITLSAVILHNNFGRAVGSLSGGYMAHACDSLFAFRIMAIMSGILGLIYLALYHFYIKARRFPIYVESSTNGHWTPLETYANGEAQDGKPMLKEKEQERY